MHVDSLVVFLCWFVGGFVSGITGIGGAMIAVPVAAMFIPMHDVIVLSCILNVAMDGSLACMHFRHCRVAALWPLFAGALPGAFFGLFILCFVPGNILQGAVGGLLIAYVYWQRVVRASGERKGGSWLVGGLAGFGAGMLGSAISFDGPPAGAYALYCGWSSREVLGTLGVFFIIRSLFTCILQDFYGLYSPEIIGYALYGIPSCILGVICAFPVVKYICVEQFRRILIMIIMIAGFICLYKSICN